MLIPLEQFYCDTCSQLIESPREGWFEWIALYDDNAKQFIDQEFRICHHNSGCQLHPHRRGCSDLPLTDFLGELGIINLLRMIDIGPYHSATYKGPTVKDFREYTKIVRRLTIPYYEEARQWWNEATYDGYFGDSNEVYIYLPRSLKSLIEHYIQK